MKKQYERKQLPDPGLLPLHDFVDSLSQVDNTEHGAGGFVIDQIKLNLPLDLQIMKNDNGNIEALNASTPNMYGPVSLTPVYHRIKMTIIATEDTHE